MVTATRTLASRACAVRMRARLRLGYRHWSCAWVSAEGCAGAAVREGMVPAFLAARCLCGGMPVSDLPSIVGWWFASTFFLVFVVLRNMPSVWPNFSHAPIFSVGLSGRSCVKSTLPAPSDAPEYDQVFGPLPYRRGQILTSAIALLLIFSFTDPSPFPHNGP